MSFILEALKKSEKNRQKPSAPNLETQHQSSAKTPTKRPLWIGLLVLFVLILNGVVLVWLFGPWQQPKAQPQEHPLTTSTYVNAERTETTAVPVVPQPVPTIETQPMAVKQQPPTVIVAPTAVPQPMTTVEIQPITVVPQPTVVAVAPTAVPQPVTTVETVEQQPAPLTTVAPVAEPEQPTAVTIRELPAHIQQQLPPFTMSVHGYAGDNNSLIRLNNKIMREGSILEGRYRLEEITPDGAIFSYQGYRFNISRTGR